MRSFSDTDIVPELSLGWRREKKETCPLKIKASSFFISLSLSYSWRDTINCFAKDMDKLLKGKPRAKE